MLNYAVRNLAEANLIFRILFVLTVNKTSVNVLNLIHYNTRYHISVTNVLQRRDLKTYLKLCTQEYTGILQTSVEKNIYIYNKPWHTMACSIHNFVSIKNSCNPITNLYFCIIVKMRVETDERPFYTHSYKSELIYISTFRDMFKAHDLQIVKLRPLRLKVFCPLLIWH